MKRTFLLALALATTAAVPADIQAQDEKPAAPAAERPTAGSGSLAERLKTLKEKLGLTDEQSAKVKSIFEKNRGEAAKVREDETLKPEEKRAKMLEMRKAEMGEVREVLTPEQKAKLREMRPVGGAGKAAAK